MDELEDPIESYLDELLVELRGSPRTVRRVLTEVESHLRDAVADGATPDEAVARFGPVREVAARCSRQAGVPMPVLARQLVLAAGLLVWIGLGAIGASGAIAGGMDAAFGPRFVAGDLPDITYTPARCADFRALAPNETSCLRGAARHHTDETVTYRGAAGVLGLIALGVWAALRRRWRSTPATGALPPALVPAVGLSLFAVAGIALSTSAMQSIGYSSNAGLGQWLSAAIVSYAVAAGFALALLRVLRRPALFA